MGLILTERKWIHWLYLIIVSFVVYIGIVNPLRANLVPGDQVEIEMDAQDIEKLYEPLVSIWQISIKRWSLKSPVKDEGNLNVFTTE